jgi:hypothetical protein
VALANSTHVVGEGDTDCGSALVQRFVARPQEIDSLDASCAAAVPPIHSVGVYPARISEQPPLQASPGNGASVADLRAAAAAVQTAGDAISRYQAIEAKHDRGLAGGSVTATHGGALLPSGATSSSKVWPSAGPSRSAPARLPSTARRRSRRSR